MSRYKANPLSRNDIRRFVRMLKRSVGMEDMLLFPVVEFMESILPIIIPDFQLEIVPVKEMGTKHGETYPSKSLIRIREDVYERAVAGEPRDRMTLAHEIGHLFIHDNDVIALCRMQPGEKLLPYEDPEWQADCFAGELLASSYLIKGFSEYEVMEKCNVSFMAARVQISKL